MSRTRGQSRSAIRHRPLAFETVEQRKMLTSPGFSSQALANEYWDVRTVADLDGDALPELIIQLEGDFHYRTNLGEGRFGVPIPLPSETSPRFVDSGDIDQDGDSDILLGGTNGVAWYENTDGKGSLSSPNWIRHRSVTRLRLEDMDSDGDIDVVAAYRVASWNRGRSIWFENIDRLGTGTFGHSVRSRHPATVMKLFEPSTLMTIPKTS